MSPLHVRRILIPSAILIGWKACLSLSGADPVGQTGLGAEPAYADTPPSPVVKVVYRDEAARAKVKPVRNEEKMEPLPEQFLAFDVSRPFGVRRTGFDRTSWKQFCEASLAMGRRMVVVQARGSRSSNPYADLLLEEARKSGLRTAAYVFLNFNRSAPSGSDQVRLSVDAMGSEAKQLDFMVVDVEAGAAGNLTPAERVNRIGQAVEAVTAAGLRPVIYAKNTGGRRGEWTDLTGNATDFSYLPLWVPRYDSQPALEVDGFGREWRSFGGWTVRHGKQFADQNSTFAPFGLPADDNVFARTLLNGPKKPKPYGVNGLVSVIAGKAKRDKKTGEVVQAVKLVNRSGSAILGPLSIVLSDLSKHSPLANGHGKGETGHPYVRIRSKRLNPGCAVETVLRFARTTSAAPTYFADVRAGSGEV
jgi:hypothetical protein